MKLDAEVRDRLHHAAGRVPVEAPPIERFVQRGRRRVALRVAAAAAAFAVVAAGFTWSATTLASLGSSGRQAPGAKPAVGSPLFKTIAVGRFPSVIVGGYGALWVGSSNDSKVTKIDPASGQVLNRVQLSPAGRLNALAIGGGAVWAAIAAYPGASVSPTGLWYIDPSSGEFHGVHVPPQDGRPSPARFLGYGAGNLWVDGGAGVLLRMDPATGHVLAKFLVPDQVQAITFGLGSVWVATGGGAFIERINPTTNHGHVQPRIPIPARPFNGQLLAVGGGRVWVCCGTGANQVLSFDAATDQAGPPVRGLPTTGVQVESMAYGNGFLWVRTGDELFRVDPRTETAAGPVTLDYSFGVIGVSPGYVWIANPSGHIGHVERLAVADFDRAVRETAPDNGSNQSLVAVVILAVCALVLGSMVALRIRGRRRARPDARI